MTLFKFKKVTDWNSELVNCAWFAFLLTYTAVMFVLQAVGACVHPDTPIVFDWPDTVWPEHPVLLSFFCILYIVLAFAIFLYGAVLTETHGENSENNQKLGNFYVNVSCMMVLGPVNWTILIIVWVIAMLFKGILATLYFFFYKLPIYFVSADERKQKKAEEAQQRKEENEYIVKKLIKDFDSIRK